MSGRAKTTPEKPKVTTKYSHIALEIQKGLATLREDEICTDFEVVVGEQSFHCHKAVLASVSDYFRAMLQSGMKETVQNKTTLDNVSPEVFKVILDLLYFKGGDADPLSDKSDDELGELLRMADMFQMKFLIKLCLDLFEKTMSVVNCVFRWKIGKAFTNDELRTLAWNFILKNFEFVGKEGLLFSLDYEEFLSIISNDSLEVKDEICVWHLISDWINFDRQNRVDKLSELLKNCCLTEIDHTVLVEEIAFDIGIRSDDIASKLVQKAIKFKNHPGDSGNVDDLKFRECMGKEQVCMGLCVGDGEEMVSMICQRPLKKSSSRNRIPELTRLTEFACCVHGRDVYISGGTGSHAVSLHRYSSVTNKWTLCTGRMGAGLKRHAMVATDTCLYVLGGRTGSSINPSVLQYSIRTGGWSLNGDLHTAVENASAVCKNGRIYVIGGMVMVNEEAVATDTIQMFDTKTRVATVISCRLPGPCAFSVAACRPDHTIVVTSNGEIIQLSGEVQLESELVAIIPDFNGMKYFWLAVKGNRLGIYGGITEDEDGNKTSSNKVVYADLSSGKVWDGKTFPKPYAFYGSLNVLMSTSFFQGMSL